MHVLILATIQRLPPVLLVDIRQHVPLRVPAQHLLRETAFDFEGLASFFGVVDVDEGAIAACCHESSVMAEGNPLKGAIGLIGKHSFADDVGNAMHFKQRILRHCGKLLIIVGEGNVGDPSAVSVDVSDAVIIFSVVERDGADVASELEQVYSPPTKNSTESLWSQEREQISWEELGLGLMVWVGAAVLR